MTSHHLDRLSAVDAGFLHQEDGRDSHMHIGGVGIFSGPKPAEDDLLEHMAGRLRLVPRFRQKLTNAPLGSGRPLWGDVPRFRQKLTNAPLGSGRPLWVDDARIRLAYHVRHTALPSPGNEEQLMRLSG